MAAIQTSPSTAELVANILNSGRNDNVYYRGSPSTQGLQSSSRPLDSPSVPKNGHQSRRLAMRTGHTFPGNQKRTLAATDRMNSLTSRASLPNSASSKDLGEADHSNITAHQIADSTNMIRSTSLPPSSTFLPSSSKSSRLWRSGTLGLDSNFAEATTHNSDSFQSSGVEADVRQIHEALSVSLEPPMLPSTVDPYTQGDDLSMDYSLPTFPESLNGPQVLQTQAPYDSQDFHWTMDSQQQNSFQSN